MKYGTEQEKEALQQKAALQEAPEKAQERIKTIISRPLLPLEKSAPAAHTELREQLRQAFKQKDKAELSTALGKAFTQVDKIEKAHQQTIEKETIKQPKISRSKGLSLWTRNHLSRNW